MPLAATEGCRLNATALPILVGLLALAALAWPLVWLVVAAMLALSLTVAALQAAQSVYDASVNTAYNVLWGKFVTAVAVHNAAVQRERLERAVVEGALESGRKDFARLMREVMTLQRSQLSPDDSRLRAANAA